VIWPSNPPAATPTGPDPRGVYLNRFTGQFSGSEWFEVTSAAGKHHFRLTDIRGGGFDATVDDDGTVHLDDGTGHFGRNRFVLHPFAGSFTFTGTRAPFTDADFPLDPTVRHRTGPPDLGGRFESRTEFLDPVSGRPRSESTETLQVNVDGDRLRVTDPGGLFFQGVFIDSNRVAFRDVALAGTPAYTSIPGSQQNVLQDFLGDLRFHGPDAFSAVFLLQTHAPLGSEKQSLLRFTARRTGPAKPSPFDVIAPGERGARTSSAAFGR
jgi:hypothetical protein